MLLERIRTFLAELKRRRVYHVAVAYGVAGAAIIAVADPVFPALLLPEWTFTLLVVVILLGFPLALGLAWALDITPEGVQRTAPATALSEASPATVGVASSRVGVGPRSAIAGAVLVGIAAGGWWLFRPGEADAALADHRVIVLPGEDRVGDETLEGMGLGTLAMEWIATDLQGSVHGVDVVPTSFVSRMMESESWSENLATDAASRTRSALVVIPSLHRLGDSVRVAAEILDGETGRLLYAIDPAMSPLDEPMAAVDVVADRVAGAIALHVDLGYLPGAQLPPDLETFRIARRGQHYFDREEFEPALVEFARAIERDSTYLLPILLSAWAHHNLGRDEASDSFIAMAQARPGGVPDIFRGGLDALYAMHHGTSEDVYQAWEGAWEVRPGINITGANAATRTRRPARALEFLAAFDPAVEWHRVEAYEWMVARTRALHALGRYEESLAVVHEAYLLDPDRENQIRTYELRALAALGRLDEIEELSRLVETRGRVRDRYTWSPGGAFRDLGVELRAHGHAEAARTAFERSLAYYDSERGRTDYGPTSTTALSGRAYALRYLGRYDEALPLLEILRDANPGSVDYAGRIAVNLAHLGDEQGALNALAGLEDPDVLVWRAGVLAILGRREEAVSLIQESLPWGGVESLHREESLESLHGWAPYEDLVRPRD